MDLALLLIAFALLGVLHLLTSTSRRRGPTVLPPPPRRRPAPLPPAPSDLAADHWEHLALLQARGNREALDRALKAKGTRFPYATRAELLEMVYRDYLRDR